MLKGAITVVSIFLIVFGTLCTRLSQRKSIFSFFGSCTVDNFKLSYHGRQHQQQSTRQSLLCFQRQLVQGTLRVPSPADPGLSIRTTSLYQPQIKITGIKIDHKSIFFHAAVKDKN